MELASDAKDGVMLRVDSGKCISPWNFTMQMMASMNSPSFASFPIIPGFTMEFSMLVGVLGLWKDDGKMLRSKVSCMP